MLIEVGFAGDGAGLQLEFCSEVGVDALSFLISVALREPMGVPSLAEPEEVRVVLPGVVALEKVHDAARVFDELLDAALLACSSCRVFN